MTIWSTTGGTHIGQTNKGLLLEEGHDLDPQEGCSGSVGSEEGSETESDVSEVFLEQDTTIVEAWSGAELLNTMKVA